VFNPYFSFPNNEPAHKIRYNETMSGYIDPSVQFKGPITVGFGVVIEDNVIFEGSNFLGHRATIRPNCIFGKGAEVRVNAWVAQDCSIGNESVIYNYANISMGTDIGDYVYFGVRSITTNANDIVLHRDRVFVPEPCHIMDGARIASHVCMKAGLTIGYNALIGAGSMLTRDVPNNEIWLGNPARKVGEVPKDDVPSAWMDSMVDKVIRGG